MPAAPDSAPFDPMSAAEAAQRRAAATGAWLPTLLIAGALQRAADRHRSGGQAVAAQQPWSRLARRARVLAVHRDTAAAPAEGAHEQWLRVRLGLPPGTAVAAASALVDGCGEATWRLDPVHLHVGLDHLVLTDPRGLEISAPEAAALVDAIAPLLREESLVIEAPDPHRWYLREVDAQRPLTLHTRSLCAANGRNIEAYLPQGVDARRWRRLINEIQMTWFDHPVNRARASHGRAAINSVWIEGRCPPACSATESLGRFAALRGQPLRSIVSIDAPGPLLQVSGHLLGVSAEQDPAAWLEAWRALNDGPVRAVARGEAPFRHGAQLVLTGDTGWREIVVSARNRWRFWRSNDPAALLLEPGAASLPEATGHRW